MTIEHLAQIKKHKEKKKEETEWERMERLNRDYNGIDWVGLYNSDKLSSLRVDELSLYFSHHKITLKCTPTLSEVETDSQSDIVDRVVGSSPSSSSDESSLETDFLPEPAQKHYRRQNMDESGHGSRETIMLVGTR